MSEGSVDYRTRRFWLHHASNTLSIALIGLLVFGIFSSEVELGYKLGSVLVILVLLYSVGHGIFYYVQFADEGIEYCSALGAKRFYPYSQVSHFSCRVRTVRIYIRGHGAIKIHGLEGDPDIIIPILESKGIRWSPDGRPRTKEQV